MRLRSVSVCTFAAALCFAASGVAQEADNDLAKKLSNPVASLISVPFQFNYDSGYGPNEGNRETLNIQPVIPFSLNDDWNLISRTIVPVIWQNDIAGPSGSQFGIGDITQSFFLSPKEPTASGIVWGVGPVFLLPTATDDMLGTGKLGLGPTAVVLKQDGPWTVGALANHIWSVAGDGGRADVSSTFLQPFVSYTTSNAWTFTLNTESTYDWEQNDWAVPINLQVSKLLKFGEQPVSLSAGARYWATAPENGPEGWGFRIGLTLLFPK
ncbi:transporter [Rhizobium laguerreae]|uniref:transporter n=1 Tax=Rhizobium laguerreae TaxID=1076926 RepID=UPI00103F8F8A|nr:transporter [Rhizobium laguerreae]TBY08156.1 transporter [Rhizobium laguerreae]